MLRDDSLPATLQPLYAGSYRILQRLGKIFVLRIGRKEVRVSVDRIKPAYILSGDTPGSAAPVPKPDLQRSNVTTRSDRHVRFTDFFQAKELVKGVRQVVEELTLCIQWMCGFR
ncbi:hypothetical protein HNY73_005753 [Argiope bruennichi]|uniref:Uncharacterized protein n=1 Tax=Argiope bruennichi TaxID=94029 RepID=A0A8T0FHP7_ARGBR|nr:hypothetical protein HNY73_005753 [Argiope bruennichi]